MRARPAWQPAQDGLMIFMPAGTASVHDTQKQLSQHEDGFKTPIKPEPKETSHSGFPSDWSPETLVGDSEEILFEAASTTLSTPEPSMGQDLLSQLIFAAERSSTEPATPGSESLSGDTRLSSTEDSVEVGYNSERTDFQEDSPSPSLRKDPRTQKRATSTRRHYQQIHNQFPTSRPVARLLDFSRFTRSNATKSPESRQRRGALERKPSHKYTSDERELLCVLYRFYCSPDERTIPKIFNSITGLELRHSVIETYFGHLCLFGRKAFRALDRVLSVPLNDPQGLYAEICLVIEQKAQDLEQSLSRRDAEPAIRYGRAQFSKSPTTRKTFKTLVQKVKEEERKEAANNVLARDVTTAARSYGTSSTAMIMPSEDYNECFVDVEPSPVHHVTEITVPKVTSSKPDLAFRVWDNSSRARFSADDGFLSEMFSSTSWNGPPLEPFVPEGQGLNAIMIFATFHMSMENKVPSAFISISTSLLQVLCKASKMTDPCISVIDLTHPAMRAPHKMLHASEILPWLKKHNQALWARYKGRTEWLCWAEIPQGAILHHFSLSDLNALANKDLQYADFLSLDVFKPSVATSSVASALREKNALLNTAIASTLGKISKLFGLVREKVSLNHIRDFIARLMDGWSIVKPETMDMHTMSSLAATFATALGRHHADHTLQDIMGAFMDGVDDGTRCIAHWSRSRSGSRRQRFRAA